MEKFITDFNEACKITGRSNELPDVSKLSPKVARREIAGHKLDVLIEANNPKGWVADLSDTTQRKWHPWFWVYKDESKAAGFRLSFDVASFAYADAFLGARHACESEALARFMGENCTELYEDYKAA